MRIRKTIIMIAIMVIIREKEIIATKKTWLIIVNKTARTLKQSCFKNPARNLSFKFLKSF